MTDEGSAGAPKGLRLLRMMMMMMMMMILLPPNCHTREHYLGEGSISPPAFGRFPSKRAKACFRRRSCCAHRCVPLALYGHWSPSNPTSRCDGFRSCRAFGSGNRTSRSPADFLQIAAQQGTFPRCTIDIAFTRSNMYLEICDFPTKRPVPYMCTKGVRRTSRDCGAKSISPTKHTRSSIAI